MVVMNVLNNMLNLLPKVQHKYPDIRFTEDDTFFWSSKDHSVHTAFNDYSQIEFWTLFHEMAHCLLEHETFDSDYDLLQMEREAWEYAKPIAKQFKIPIDDNHIEDCLDTYRDWLHKRSLCKQCGVNGIQLSERKYRCLSCNDTWAVTQKQLCRVYRIQKNT